MHAQGTAEVCPETCMNLGSFRVVFESAASCLCNTADQYPVLLSTITDIWKVRACHNYQQEISNRGSRCLSGRMPKLQSLGGGLAMMNVKRQGLVKVQQHVPHATLSWPLC